MKRFVLYILCAICILVSYFFIGTPPRAKDITWGVNFSQKHAEHFGFEWEEVYTSLINELGVTHIKLATYWDVLEKDKGAYDFSDVDRQVQIAEQNNVKLIIVIGMKTPRWPECHIPEWANGLSQKKQKRYIQRLISTLVYRYRQSPSLQYWQVENEAFFPYGECPWADASFLQKEVQLVRLIDPHHPIIITDSGEGSLWIQAGRIGDIVGTTMYKKVWSRQINRYVYYPLPPIFYWRKAQVIERLYNKPVHVVELQAEPWGPSLLYDTSVKEQRKTMNPEQFNGIISYARQTGFNTFYFWGAEWWYWMKEAHVEDGVWNLARDVFKE